MASYSEKLAQELESLSGAVKDPQFWSDIKRNLIDVPHGAARGMSADLLGLPVDTAANIANLGIAGYGVGKRALTGSADLPEPISNYVGGSHWIGKQMEKAGVLRPETGSAAETAGRIVGPFTATPKTIAAVGTTGEKVGKALMERAAREVDLHADLLGARHYVVPQEKSFRDTVKAPPVEVPAPTVYEVGDPQALAAQLQQRQPPPPLLGRHETSTAGRILNKTKAQGGYSVNLASGDVPESGLMMGAYKNTDPRNIVTEKALKQADLLRSAQINKAQLENPNKYMGTWTDPATGKTYIDVSRRFEPEDIRQATKFGERSGQISGYDVGKGETFPVGNWQEFVRSPEFHERMNVMHDKGADYLKQFPTKEWWDMHGGPFERVYGPENMKQVAGFTATTAPNTAPRENLQTMSEYLRRYIKREPTVQPDWRVPEGEMTRLAGKKIGMETGRAANLRKSAAGDLEALREDKVREEAAALMGDPNAVVLDRHQARLAEDPSRGIFTGPKEGLIDPGKQYKTLKDQFIVAAKNRGMSARDYSANVWTGIREHIKANSELFGQKFKGGSITGESKSYADHFEHLIADKAKHLGISVAEMESRLKKGDATLMSALLATPVGAAVYGSFSEQGD